MTKAEIKSQWEKRVVFVGKESSWINKILG